VLENTLNTKNQFIFFDKNWILDFVLRGFFIKYYNACSTTYVAIIKPWV
jgi:hypothetical protein